MVDRQTVLLIDGANAYAAAKMLGFQIDYKKVLETYSSPVHKAFFFTALKDEGEHSLVRPMVDYLTYNGWSVITKPMRGWYDPDLGRERLKGNMDTEICVIAWEMAMLGYDLTLFSGDGDFKYLIETLQRRYGTRVTVVSTIKSKPPMCADILRRQADEFIEMDEQRNNIAKGRE